MKRSTLAWILFAVALVAAAPTGARPGRGYGPRARRGFAQPREPAFQPPASVGPASEGIIRWNTPNASGNLGGPSTGGGGGGGG